MSFAFNSCLSISQSGQKAFKAEVAWQDSFCVYDPVNWKLHFKMPINDHFSNARKSSENSLLDSFLPPPRAAKAKKKNLTLSNDWCQNEVHVIQALCWSRQKGENTFSEAIIFLECLLKLFNHFKLKDKSFFESTWGQKQTDNLNLWSAALQWAECWWWKPICPHHTLLDLIP